MFGRTKPKVLVIGAGPVGLFTALCLSRRGVPVRIVDSEWRPAAHSYALALHSSSLQLLDELGLLQEVLTDAYRVRTISFFTGSDQLAQLPLQSGSGDFSFVAVVRQNQLERLLANALEQEGVSVEWNHRAGRVEATPDTVHVEINKLVKESMGYTVAHTENLVQSSRQMEVPFVIGADGHRSLTRRSMSIAFPELDEAQNFAVFEFKTDTDALHELRVVFGERDTNVLWPLANGFCRWSFQALEADFPPRNRLKDRVAVQIGADHFPQIAEEQCHQLIQERAPWFRGSVGEFHWRVAVRFERRLAESFGQERVWLVGDAAHLNYPVGAQSMNVGLREGNELAEIMAAILSGKATPERLEDYGNARLAEWNFLLGRGARIVPGPESEPWLSRCVDRVIPCLPASGDDLLHFVRELGLEIAGDH